MYLRTLTTLFFVLCIASSGFAKNLEELYDKALETMKGGDNRGAYTLIKKAMEIDHTNFYANYLYADLSSRIGQKQEAIDVYKALQRFFPDLAAKKVISQGIGWNYYLLGLQYQEKVELANYMYEQAAIFYEEACELQPTAFNHYWAGRSHLALMPANLREARRHLEKAVQLAPNDYSIYEYLAKATYRIGEVQHAFTVLNKGIQNATEPQPLLLARAGLSARKGYKVQALEDLNAIITTNTFASEYNGGYWTINEEFVRKAARELASPNPSAETISMLSGLGL